MKIGRQTSHEAEMKIDLKNTEWVTDMYWKMEGTQSFEDFIQLAVTQMTPRRRYGYVRLYLYPTKKDFYENEGKFFAILIRKRDIRVVGVQFVSREIFEIGRDYETKRVNNLIENKTDTRMDGEDKYMALIPKEWTNMSNCARRNLVPG
nr:hypothetical protein [Tanacetum cinerariifolium]